MKVREVIKLLYFRMIVISFKEIGRICASNGIKGKTIPCILSSRRKGHPKVDSLNTRRRVKCKEFHPEVAKGKGSAISCDDGQDDSVICGCTPM